MTREAARSVGRRQDTYRQDGDDDPHGTEHGVVDGLTAFQGVLDALIVAVKPTTVRLNGACLDDEEGQSRWGNTQERSVQGAEGEHPTAETTPNVRQKCYSNSSVSGSLRPLRSSRDLYPPSPHSSPPGKMTSSFFCPLSAQRGVVEELGKGSSTPC